MKTRHSVALAAVFAMSPARIDAQRLAAEFPRFQPRLSTLQQPDTARRTRASMVGDYTWEGAAIGGLLLGAFGAYFGGGMCGMDGAGRNCTLAALTGFLGGASVGATLGGIIGSTKQRPPARRPTDSILGPGPGDGRVPVPSQPDSSLFPRARNHSGNGAALGAVMVGGAVGLFTALGCGIDQSGEEHNCALKAVKRGTMGAVIGGVTGAFLGTLLSPGSRGP